MSKTREMPAAFSSGRDRGRDDDRRHQAEQQAAREYREARERKAAAEEAAKREALALDFGSEAAYPSLGGAAAASKKPSAWMSPSPGAGTFRDKAVALKERDEAEARAAAIAARQNQSQNRYESIHTIHVRPRFQAPFYATEGAMHAENDGDDGYESEHQEMAYADDEEEDGEFNADILSGRRRGDKGIW